MTHVLELISVWAIPLVVAFVSLYAIIKKVPVYSTFTEGAKEGFSTVFHTLLQCFVQSECLEHQAPWTGS